LRERAILVRHFAVEGIDHYLRISIGTPAECEQLHRALGELVAA
jgi:histidinol-phosphate aminotransferase